MQIGLKPDEVLDMSLEVFQACIKGYSDRLFDQQILGVQQGYWAGYYSSSKKPKPLKSIVKKLIRSRSKHALENPATNVGKPEVDVQAFQAMEEQFLRRQKQLNK